MKISSSAFKDGGNIPDEYSMYFADKIPRLQIDDVPPTARSLAVIVEDPDATKGTFTHWLLFNVDPHTRELSGVLPAGAIQGKNDNGITGYNGPKPPSGEHRYFFKAFALDRQLQLPEGVSRLELESEMHNHILTTATLMGRYACK